MAATYEFNRVRPPKMKDFDGDIYGVPNDALREIVGWKEWKTTSPLRGGVVYLKGEVLETRFKLTRVLFWSLLVHPEHFAESITRKITIISGVSEIEQHTMERGLESKAGASGFGLSAEVKATLKITDQTTREWHSERKEESEQAFEAGCTYCSWVLTDALILDKAVQRMYLDKPSPVDPRIVTSHFEFNCILSTYQDKWKETVARALTMEELVRYAAPHAAAPSTITLPSGRLVSHQPFEAPTWIPESEEELVEA